ncbi:toxin-antitoxin system YwqK family antitoxin [Streptomonospora nanhaiensis]|uniref:Antitoxin component YwqK of YwqJK toxin-antitoxin module n=1 Tax=Streptomonospora nanhaiensis TaxID=1323731 RepID=A0A853BUZ6_9ACTN|nr:hypothetical protein [Streptomonospora nanhaiensis]MBV2367075.1 hypothetical protein [Streptomonospora nanhaiensis]MBX9390925.1 hypothetical protein [Streptomonospora nanhaiensis]NYI98606.1 antitoxin component YwqK of YwqJK toxin-antitoxin module [Streptomonospora nanhaiensis]
MRVTDAEVEPGEDGTVLYRGAPYTGEVVELAPGGAVVALVTYRRGREHGPWREWYPDGTLKVEGRVEFGRGAVGTWRTWHANGRLAEEHEFDGLGRRRAERRWDAEGVPTVERVFADPA